MLKHPVDLVLGTHVTKQQATWFAATKVRLRSVAFVRGHRLAVGYGTDALTDRIAADGHCFAASRTTLQVIGLRAHRGSKFFSGIPTQNAAVIGHMCPGPIAPANNRQTICAAAWPAP